MGSIFASIFVVGGLLLLFWFVVLGPAFVCDWRRNKDKQRLALVGLPYEHQQLLWALHRAGPAPSSAIDPRPDFHACREAGIDEWRIRVFDP